MAPEQRNTPEELVARALESLTSEERQQVTAWLLRRPATGTRAAWLSRQAVPDPLLQPMATSQSFMDLYSRGVLGQGSAPGAGQGNQVVPVRLPADLHTRLREWSAEHGFSMATVVRGLVSRFLEGQEPVVAGPES